MDVYKRFRMVGLLILFAGFSSVLRSAESKVDDEAAKYYIQIPDKYGNACYGHVVIEATVSVVYDLEILNVIAPQDFKDNWTRLQKRLFVECEGPSRELTKAAHLALVKELYSSKKDLE